MRETRSLHCTSDVGGRVGRMRATTLKYQRSVWRGVGRSGQERPRGSSFETQPGRKNIRSETLMPLVMSPFLVPRTRGLANSMVCPILLSD